MKKLLLITSIILMSTSVWAEEAAPESVEHVPFRHVTSDERMQALVLVVMSGVNCPVVTDLMPYVWSTGYTVYCSNHIRFKIEPDARGYLEVTLK